MKSMCSLCFIHSTLTLLDASLLQLREHPQRASRILLDIEAGAPVILIPESSQSLKVLVANLGRLRVQNSFVLAGAHGTFSSREEVEQRTVLLVITTCPCQS